MVILSVDLGKARTGIAVSDKNESMAFPKDIIKEYNTEKLVLKIAEQIRLYNAELVVVGLPKNMDGTKGFKAKECEETAQKIEEVSKVKTVLYDERCTTVLAANTLKSGGVFGKKRKEVLDSVAAVMILEDFLRYKKNKENL